MKQLIEKLGDMDACDEGLDWLQTQSDPKTAWENCHSGAWLEWLLLEFDVDCQFSEIRAEYEAKIQQALDEFLTETKPFRVEYFAKIDPIGAEFKANTTRNQTELWREYHIIVSRYYAEFEAKTDTAHDKYQAKVAVLDLEYADKIRAVVNFDDVLAALA